ncbi:hypothetical protein M0802_012845 [Mischocyttarus mexicanus]|nr:hypothetical protein M0802_012845 [Mischocyttarus mexicanus]
MEEYERRRREEEQRNWSSSFLSSSWLFCGTFKDYQYQSKIALSAILAVAYGNPGFLYGVHPAPIAYARLVPGAPIGVDGRVVDTPEVAVAKAEHAAAHINERINLANEAVKSAEVIVPAATLGASIAAAPVIASAETDLAAS